MLIFMPTSLLVIYLQNWYGKLLSLFLQLLEDHAVWIEELF